MYKEQTNISLNCREYHEYRTACNINKRYNRNLLMKKTKNRYENLAIIFFTIIIDKPFGKNNTRIGSLDFSSSKHITKYRIGEKS